MANTDATDVIPEVNLKQLPSGHRVAITAVSDEGVHCFIVTDNAFASPQTANPALADMLLTEMPAGSPVKLKTIPVTMLAQVALGKPLSFGGSSTVYTVIKLEIE